MTERSNINMKSGSYAFALIYMALAVFALSGIPASAANRVEKIEESALDARIGSKTNCMAVVFMAAWCAPCIDELPTMNKLYKKFKKQNLEIIGISIDLEGPKAMQPIVSGMKIDFPVYWYGEKAIEKFAIFAIPMMLLIKEGEIVERIHGRRPETYLDDKFIQFLK
jgi:thiol-disulfide isomerase/thioredoxin